MRFSTIDWVVPIIAGLLAILIMFLVIELADNKPYHWVLVNGKYYKFSIPDHGLPYCPPDPEECE